MVSCLPWFWEIKLSSVTSFVAVSCRPEFGKALRLLVNSGPSRVKVTDAIAVVSVIKVIIKTDTAL